jgi:hypothetical protein
MRKTWWAPLTACVVLAAAGAGRADDQAEARALVDKAIKAAGGEAKLAQLKASTWKAKGTFYGMGEGIPYTSEMAFQYPDRQKVTIEGNVNNMNFSFTFVVNGDKGWAKLGDNTEEMAADRLKETKEEMYAGWVTRLLPVKDKAFTLAPLGEVKVGDRPALGVKISHKGHRDINVYFDKETSLLVKSEATVKDDQSDKEVSQEVVFSKHKEIDGVKVPMKVDIKRDGKRYVEAENTEVKFADKLDDSVFAKP